MYTHHLKMEVEQVDIQMLNITSIKNIFCMFRTIFFAELSALSLQCGTSKRLSKI